MENPVLSEKPTETPLEQAEEKRSTNVEHHKEVIEENFIQKVDNYSQGIANWRSVHQYFREVSSAIGSTVKIGSEEIIMLGSNDYLGLSNHPIVKEEAIKAITEYGIGSGSTAVLSGTFDLHNELEKELADFKGAEAALLFSTGFLTNYGVITTLLDKDYIIINDEKNHISILEGCRAVRARTRMFRHNDMESLEKILKLYENNKKVIIVEGIYSMDGDIANLPEIVLSAKRYNAQLIIDDAHATGVLGENGMGSLEYFNLDSGADIVTDSLGKSFGGIGGFITGSRVIIDHLKHLCPSYIFTTNLPPMICATTLAGLRLIRKERLWQQLWKNVKMLRNGLSDIGFDLGNSQAHIIPLIIGDELKTYEFARLMQKESVYVSAVGRPAVPRGAARLRITPMATHTAENISRALDAFKNVGKKIGVI